MKSKSQKSFLQTVYKIVTVIAPFGFILSIAFFMAQTQKSVKLVNKLSGIEQSLSTRHIGIFPDYLDKINELLLEKPSNDDAAVVIFEDVLFYGAFYNGAAFKEMVENLTKISTQGRQITIAYYDNSDNSNNRRTNRMFREVVQESWMRQNDLPLLTEERITLLRDTSFCPQLTGQKRFNYIDSVTSEKYFAVYRDKDRAEFNRRLEKILVPLYDASKNDYQVFKQIDEIKQKYLKKDAASITFADFYSTYKEFTDNLAAFYRTNKIQLIPLTNYLTMSCWSNGEKVLFALPGRYAADEIGFISHDLAILRYIDTMLKGVKSSGKEDN
ncbi:MAG: hypothetical protein LBB41_05555 [Prevotellaceae bacterium]|jgi:hypothetical protein|nr:hypothetical protein [Prevotellaceae bacterium]